MQDIGLERILKKSVLDIEGLKIGSYPCKKDFFHPFRAILGITTEKMQIVRRVLEKG